MKGDQLTEEMTITVWTNTAVMGMKNEYALEKNPGNRM